MDTEPKRKPITIPTRLRYMYNYLDIVSGGLLCPTSEEQVDLGLLEEK